MTTYAGRWIDYVRNGGHLHAYGTSSGVKKAWLKRQRAKHQEPAPKPIRSIPAYHGTYSTVLDQIMKEGILPGNKVNRVWGKQDYHRGEREEAVFASASQDRAKRWAWEAAARMGANECIVLHVEIPESVRSYRDTEAASSMDFFVKQAIPPEWIVGHDRYVNRATGSYLWEKIEHVGKNLAAAKFKSVYVPIVIGGNK